MRMENPLSGWPKTKPLKGKIGYRVRAKYLTPLRAKWTDNVFGILCIGCLGLILWGFATDSYVKGGALEGYAVVLFVGWVLVGSAVMALRYRIGRRFFGKRTAIEFHPDTIRIKSGMRYKNYDRGLPHAFDYSIHDKALQEEEQEFESRQKKGKYYRNAFHIVLRYAGQRVDVASVFGKKHAEALLVRLQLLDQMMDAARGDVASAALSEPATLYGERPEAG